MNQSHFFSRSVIVFGSLLLCAGLARAKDTCGEQPKFADFVTCTKPPAALFVCESQAIDFRKAVIEWRQCMIEQSTKANQDFLLMLTERTDRQIEAAIKFQFCATAEKAAACRP